MLTETLTKYSSLFLQNIDKNDIRIFLESSPLYPNLLSVLQTLQYVGLDVHAGQCDWEYMSNLKSPFLLHINIKSKETLAISRWNPDLNVLEILHPARNKWETNSKEDIADVWDGVVIYTDVTPIRNVIAKKDLMLVVSIVLFVLVVCVLFEKHGVNAIYASPVLLGLAVSACIYRQNYVSPIGIVDKICHSSSVADCDAVTKSGYGNLGGISMSSLALSYFLSQLSCLLMAYALGLTNPTYTLDLVSTIVVVPVTVYSAYSQWKIKKICPLCLIILACVIIQAAVFVYIPSGTINLGLLTVWVACAVCYLCLFTLYSHNRLNQHENLGTRIENLKLKRSKDVLLMKSSSAGHVKAPISLGVETSRINVTTIISPSCRHCRKIVSELLSLTEQKIEFRWNIILGTTAINDPEKIKIWIQSYIYDKNKFIQDLYLWSSGRIRNLSYKSGTDPHDSKVKEMCRDNDRQIENLNISGFPQIILNGRLLSPVYSTEDLELMIFDQSNIMTS